MSKSFYTWTKSHKVLLFAILLVAAIAVVGIVSVVRAPAPDSGGTASDSAKITKIGTVVCLPHKNSDGPQTLECAMGLKAEDGKHYALKDEDSAGGESIINGVFNKRVEVSGVFSQANDAIYDVAGSIAIIKLKVLE